MTNYTKTTDFAAKDALPSGNSAKIVKGSEIDTEFNNIATASATKANANAAALTGTTTFETISDGTISITAFVDEDNMASNSATLLPTQQSVKAYVDSQVTAQDLDFQADSGGALSIDLDSETLTFTGGTGVDTSGSGNAVTFAIDSTVATLTGTQTLSNKTLSAPVVSGNLTTDGLIDGRDVATDGTKLDGIEAGATADQTAAEIRTLVESATDSNVFTDADHSKLNGIEANATADQTAAEIRALVESATDSNVFTDADHSKLNGIEASADVTDTANVTAAGALMDSELTSEASVKALNQGVATTDSPSFAGLTTTADVSFGDNDKAIFGAGSDLQIYHDGTHSYVRDEGTGGLILTTNGAAVYIQKGDTETSAEFNIDGAVKLRHDNLQKFATTSTGIDVTGTVTSDGLTSDGGISIDESGTAINITNGDGLTQLGKFHGETTDGFVIEGKSNNNLTLRTKANTAGEGIKFQDSAGDNMMFIDGITGDISFYEDTGTTAKFLWDASLERLTLNGSGAGSLLLDRGASGNQIKFDNAGTTLGYLGYTDGTGFTFAGSDGGADMVIDSSGNVGIGTTSPQGSLDVQTSSGENLVLGNGAGADWSLTAGSVLIFKDDGTERMRIDSSGNLLVGTTSTSPHSSSSVEGIALRTDVGGFLGISRSGGQVASFNRISGNGDIVDFRKDGAAVGSIGTTLSSLYIGGSSNGAIYFNGTTDVRPWNTSTQANLDNTMDLGGIAARWDDIYATNGTIQTSDRNEKQDIEALSDAEQRVAVAAKGLLRKFRWISSVEDKGDEARIHFGIIAQDLQDAFTAEGLDAGRYAMFISTTWTDEETGEERSRLGVRYSELLAFIIAAI